jgi:hypothetical protein
MRKPFDLTAEADELVPQICRFPAISNVIPDTHQTTDKCRRDRHRKFIRISARCSANQIAVGAFKPAVMIFEIAAAVRA